MHTVEPHETADARKKRNPSGRLKRATACVEALDRTPGTLRALLLLCHPLEPAQTTGSGRVDGWRGDVRFWGVAVCRRLSPYAGASIRTMVPFPVAARRTGRADFPHPALGQGITPSPTESCTYALIAG